MEELAKTYNPKETEDKIYELWQKADAFKPAYGVSHMAYRKDDKRQAINDSSADEASDKPPFTIVIPPPNVTGSLHMGHALNNTIQDILVRRKRMEGVPTLWLPGTDHAGIATQNVVEKKLAKVGKKRQDMGREAFEKEIWTWVDEYGHIIVDQLKKLGCSCDWSRQRFTMDDDYAEAVNTAFKHYYDKGWIYQGERVINWCTRCQTALSDIEVEYEEKPTTLYFFKYDKDFPITIATTRPETKIGDTAVAVNPGDIRYKDFIGKIFDVDFAGVKRKIKVIADPAVDKSFGTGALGVTPAHSLADAEMAEKNNLESITVIDKYGKMTKEAGKDYEGLKTFEAQTKLVDYLKAKDLIEKQEQITHNLSVCYRCNRPIEPQPSKQWFLKMSELIKPAIKAVKDGEIKINPDRWKKVYLNWMENIHDWCISRQLWWGHRLPVYTKQERISNDKFLISNQIPNPNIKNSNIENSLKIDNFELKIYVGNNPPGGYTQVSDVLDTWFSSALWPFATLGWPQQANTSISHIAYGDSENQKVTAIRDKRYAISDLDRFYPTSVLSTARDINMLWVVRMIYSGYEFMGQKPFSQVYIHPTVFNKEGKRMSKSLGTGVDPLELIDRYGTDATRFGLMYINTGTQDIKFDEAAILASQKFGNKIWNIARFTIMQIQNSKIKNQNDNVKFKIKSEADGKITQSLNHLITCVNNDLDNFRFGQTAHSLYDFIWHDLADQYIEASKKEPNTEVLLYVLTTILKLLHPFMPFLTEEIWQKLVKENLVEEELLIKARWPNTN